MAFPAQRGSKHCTVEMAQARVTLLGSAVTFSLRNVSLQSQVVRHDRGETLCCASIPSCLPTLLLKQMGCGLAVLDPLSWCRLLAP
jgi:hypothetical protein